MTLFLLSAIAAPAPAPRPSPLPWANLQSGEHRKCVLYWEGHGCWWYTFRSDGSYQARSMPVDYTRAGTWRWDASDRVLTMTTDRDGPYGIRQWTVEFTRARSKTGKSDTAPHGWPAYKTHQITVEVRPAD